VGPPSFDTAILGAGFSGALLARILASRGRSVLLVERGRHPRLAVGESSTPIADLILDQLCDRYRLSDVAPLARYGRWIRECPQLMRGCKRGFSYFQHHPGRPFEETEDHSHSLLVTASASDAVADTHWMRADVDHYLVQGAVAAGVDYRDQTSLAGLAPGPPWKLTLRRARETQTATAEFLVDASGAAGAVADSLGLADWRPRMRTATHSCFAHLVDVGSWSERLRREGHSLDDHPFDADAAAQHHLLEEGWLWMLRMDDGRTSVGWTRPLGDPANRQAMAAGLPRPSSAPGVGARPADDLAELFGLAPYPSLLALLSGARLVAPATGALHSGPLQRLRAPAAGDRWALMPTTAATIDPLHSSGIAHALSGVERLAALLLETDAGTPHRRGRLAVYADQVLRESLLMDRLVAACYASWHDFARFVAASSLYFIAAIRCEERRAGSSAEGLPLWSVDDRKLVDRLDHFTDRLEQLGRSDRWGRDPKATAALIDQMRGELDPWNSAGLLDPDASNMYAYTAAAKRPGNDPR
jgi:tetracycline 7-halogenase / FADH2 O2-dependent halogenase